MEDSDARFHLEDGSSMTLRNVGVLTTTLHGVTTQETTTRILIDVKASCQDSHHYIYIICIKSKGH